MSVLAELSAVVMTIIRCREIRMNKGDEEDEQHDPTDDCQHP